MKSSISFAGARVFPNRQNESRKPAEQGPLGKYREAFFVSLGTFFLHNAPDSEPICPENRLFRFATLLAFFICPHFYYLCPLMQNRPEEGSSRG